MSDDDNDKSTRREEISAAVEGIGQGVLMALLSLLPLFLCLKERLTHEPEPCILEPFAQQLLLTIGSDLALPSEQIAPLVANPLTCAWQMLLLFALGLPIGGARAYVAGQMIGRGLRPKTAWERFLTSPSHIGVVWLIMAVLFIFSCFYPQSLGVAGLCMIFCGYSVAYILALWLVVPYARRRKAEGH